MYTISDTVSGPDTEDHRKALAKQAILRAQLEQLIDSLQLDALAYPTMRADTHAATGSRRCAVAGMELRHDDHTDARCSHAHHRRSGTQRVALVSQRARTSRRTDCAGVATSGRGDGG